MHYRRKILFYHRLLHCQNKLKIVCSLRVTIGQKEKPLQVFGLQGFMKKLPETPKNPNFSVTIYVGMNYKKKGNRQSIVL